MPLPEPDHPPPSPPPPIPDDTEEDQEEGGGGEDDGSMEEEHEEEVIRTNGEGQASSLPLEIPPISTFPAAAATSDSAAKPAAAALAGGDARRLFQRLWTDEDEIAILQGFYDFTSQRGTTHHAHQHDTGPFYDQIRSRLQLDFTKSQLVEKLRRLKKKYRNVVARVGSGRGGGFAFKSPHDHATFDISRRIWGGSLRCALDHEEREEFVVECDEGRRRRGRKRAVAAAAAVEVEEVKALPTPVLAMPAPGGTAKAVPETRELDGVVEETVRSCLRPVLKEVHSFPNNVSLVMPGGLGLPGNLVPTAGLDDDRWRKQQIMELEVYSKRLDLVQEQIKVALTQLRTGR